ICMAAMTLWPMFLVPATHGMPDAFGLVFVAMILMLTVDFRFDSLPPARLAVLFAAPFALVLTRRWYMFLIVVYDPLFALAVLVGAARRRVFGRTLGNLFKFGIPSVVVTIVALLPTFRTILSTYYVDIYGAYYSGGFWVICLDQLRAQGIILLALAAGGLLLALRRKETRAPALVLAGASLLAMILFTHTQSLGDHQALILAPAYLAGLFRLAAAVCGVQRAALARGGAGALAAFFLLNCGNALRLPGASVSTLLLSDRSLDLTRRTDLDAMAAVTDFVLANCGTDETVYINIDSDGYSGTTFAFSDP